MGFRGFKGSIGEKGYSISARDFNGCQGGWTQIINTRNCYRVLNDIPLNNFGIASATCSNQIVFGSRLSLATFSSLSEFNTIADQVAASSSSSGAIVISLFQVLLGFEF